MNMNMVGRKAKVILRMIELWKVILIHELMLILLADEYVGS